MQRSILAYAVVGALALAFVFVVDRSGSRPTPSSGASDGAVPSAVARPTPDADAPGIDRAPLVVEIAGLENLDAGARRSVVLAPLPRADRGPVDLEVALAKGRVFPLVGNLAKVPRPTADALIGCTVGDHFAVAHVNAATEKVELVLERDCEAHVRVRNRAGQPVAGLPVAFRVQLGSTHLDALVRRTDAGGQATLRHLTQYRLGGAGAATAAPRNLYHVALAIPTLTPIQAPVDPDAPPREMIELVLPETGRVAVTVLAPDGRIVRQPGVVTLHVAAARPGLPTPVGATADLGAGFEQPLRGGRAVFEHVALDLQLLVVARVGNTLAELARPSRRFAGNGPTRPGGTESVTLRLRRDDIEFSGVVVGADGKPLEHTRLDYAFRAPDAHNATMAKGTLTTDGAGRFRVTLPGSRRVYTRRLELEGAGRRARFDFDPNASQGRVELGRARLL